MLLFGVLAIDKPAGWTSRDAVNRVQRFVRPAKIGHTGTLDPMATGVLLLPIGPATRLVEFAHHMPKCYEADFQLGCVSDTLDSTGQRQAIVDAPVISRDAWLIEMEKWKGVVRQRPPMYSAVQVGGRRAYDLARRGQIAELPSREITIHELELLDFDYPRVSLRVRCSTGTYIRSLGADMAAALGSGAIMTRLVRTEIGNYKLSDCVSMDSLNNRESVASRMTSPLGLLPQLAQVTLDAEQCRDIRHGKLLAIQSTGGPQSSIHANVQPTPKIDEHSLIAAIDSKGALVGILQPIDEHYRSVRVFQNE